MNLNEMHEAKPLESYISPSFFQRTKSAVVDNILVGFLRAIGVILCVVAFFKPAFISLQAEFQQKFGIDIATAVQQLTPEQKEVIASSGFGLAFLNSVMIIIGIGAIYYAIMLSSKKMSTVGMRLQKIALVDYKTGGKVGFWRCLARYFLSLIPLILPIIATIMVFFKSLNFSLVLIVILTAIWNDNIGIFSIKKNRKKLFRPLHDTICRTVLIKK
jgi:uncharacterized RDD family membrane protein YckC